MKHAAKLTLILPLALSLMSGSALAESGAHIETATRALIMAVDLAEKAPLAQDLRASAVGVPQDFRRDKGYASAFDGAERVVLAAANPAAAQMGIARNGGTAVTGAGFSSNVFMEVLPEGTEAVAAAGAGTGGTGGTGTGVGVLLPVEQLAVATRVRPALTVAEHVLWAEKHYPRPVAALSAARASEFVSFARPVTSVAVIERLEMTKVERVLPAAVEAVAVDKLSLARGF